MSGAPTYSLIIRAKDEAESLERCLAIIHSQRIEAGSLEVIVVDGGSRDATVEVARRSGALIETIAPREFNYGRALNLGCARASGQILVPVSGHAFLPDLDWLRRITEPLGEAGVACASGDRWGPSGEPLRARVRQDAWLARAVPEWGYSNTAGALRADLWRRRPFREDLVACEDREWAWHWLGEGYVCVVDPAFSVDHDHTHDPARRMYLRSRLEWEGTGSFHELGPYDAGDLLGDWWSDLRWYRSPWRARLSHRRAARLLGGYAGRRRALRRRRPRPEVSR